MNRWNILGAILLLANSIAAQLAVSGELVYTGRGDPLRNAVVLTEGRRILRVLQAPAEIPPGYEVVTAKVVTPGLIDAHSVVGLSGHLNHAHDQDQLDGSGPIQPELRAIDAYNGRERLVEWVRGLGVTTLHTGHAPRALVSGQTMVVKTTGAAVDDAVIVPFAMVAATLGDGARGGDGKSPGTRSKALAMLRAELLAAQEYVRERADAQTPPKRDLRREALAAVVTREKPLLLTAHRAHDILSALRLAKELDLRLVLDGVAEGHLVLDALAAAKVPVIVHPPMMRASGETENATMEAARLLSERGIPFAFQTGFESYVPKTRVLLFEAAIAVRHGLPRAEALARLTHQAAEILGVADRVGSLQPGFDADFALFDGDPFAYTSHCTGVVIDGRVMSRTAR